MIIGFDVDGVIYPWHSEVYDYFQWQHGYKGSYKEFWKEYIPTIQETTLLDNMIADPTLYARRSIKLTYLRALWEIAGLGYEIWYVSSLHKEARQERIKWFSSNGLPYPENYKFVDGISKRKAILDIGCDYFVEDRIPTIEDLLGHVFMFVIDQPWNEELGNGSAMILHGDIVGEFLRIPNVSVLPEYLMGWKGLENVYR
ncbi:hypothetical protein LCGC14_0869530 [marine sediment metagenome]|uniref:Nucleotidase n=1 Tax=marine sediment metagenome TaxID=412755 RepID=A0A0F9PQR2_9ZZZZ